jgi:hypothetical protein
MVVFGTVALLGVFYAVMPSRRNPSTLLMLEAFRNVMGKFHGVYWLIIICESVCRSQVPG